VWIQRLEVLKSCIRGYVCHLSRFSLVLTSLVLNVSFGPVCTAKGDLKGIDNSCGESPLNLLRLLTPHSQSLHTLSHALVVSKDTVSIQSAWYEMQMISTATATKMFI